jgi:hypothetical protein
MKNDRKSQEAFAGRMSGEFRPEMSGLRPDCLRRRPNLHQRPHSRQRHALAQGRTFAAAFVQVDVCFIIRKSLLQSNL